eukprot:TRINITY_DN5360_c0_g1_i1.p1 TRINITY_DN5360_c0_g1~~TRINITY_DN5360_c0_g1_i1.p1  ORF type:complete len:494 (+),score=62.52 TRINITY_DN5360_c0_g1_i1:3-1484(+)
MSIVVTGPPEVSKRGRARKRSSSSTETQTPQGSPMISTSHRKRQHKSQPRHQRKHSRNATKKPAAVSHSGRHSKKHLGVDGKDKPESSQSSKVKISQRENVSSESDKDSEKSNFSNHSEPVIRAPAPPSNLGKPRTSLPAIVKLPGPKRSQSSTPGGIKSSSRSKSRGQDPKAPHSAHPGRRKPAALRVAVTSRHESSRAIMYSPSESGPNSKLSSKSKKPVRNKRVLLDDDPPIPESPCPEKIPPLYIIPPEDEVYMLSRKSQKKAEKSVAKWEREKSHEIESYTWKCSLIKIDIKGVVEKWEQLVGRGRLRITRQQFIDGFTPELQQQYRITPAAVPWIFDVFDHDRDYILAMIDFVRGVSAVVRGTQKMRCEFAFKMFDYRQNGKIDFREFLHVWTLMSAGTWDLRLAKKGTSPPTNEELIEECEDLFTVADSTHVGFIDHDRFIEWAPTSPAFSEECLRVLKKTCRLFLDVTNQQAYLSGNYSHLNRIS